MSESGVNESDVVASSDQPEVIPVRLMPGAQLAVRRQALGWSVEQVASQLRLAPRQILAIETDSYDSLPCMASVRGFIRVYAKLLGLDGGQLVEIISDKKGSGLMLVRRELSTPFAEMPLPELNRRQRFSKSLIFMMVLIIFSLVLVVQLMGWVPVTLQENLSRLLDPHVFSMIATPIVKTEPLNTASQVNTVLAVVEPTPVNDSSSIVDVAPILSELKLVETKESKGLVLHLREDSWVEVKREDGVILISRLLKAGTTETVEFTGIVQLVVGNPSGVDATLHGAILELKPVVGSNAARLSLK